MILGIDGTTSFLWISNNSVSFKKHKENAVVALWIQSHVQKDEFAFTSKVAHMQSLFEKSMPNIIGVVIELKQSKMVGYDFFKLTTTAREAVKSCQLSTLLHESCTDPAFFESVLNDVSIHTSELATAIIDCRISSCIFMEMPKDDIHMKCCSCKKYFLAKSIMQHIARNKSCKLQDVVKEYYKKLTQGYSMDRKRKYQAKWDEDNREYKLSKNVKYRKENKNSKAAYDAKRYQESKKEGGQVKARTKWQLFRSARTSWNTFVRPLACLLVGKKNLDQL